MTDTIPCPPPFEEELLEHGYVREVDESERFIVVELPRAARLPSVGDEVELQFLYGAEP